MASYFNAHNYGIFSKRESFQNHTPLFLSTSQPPLWFKQAPSLVHFSCILDLQRNYYCYHPTKDMVCQWDCKPSFLEATLCFTFLHKNLDFTCTGTTLKHYKVSDETFKLQQNMYLVLHCRLCFEWHTSSSTRLNQSLPAAWSRKKLFFTQCEDRAAAGQINRCLLTFGLRRLSLLSPALCLFSFLPLVPRFFNSFQLFHLFFSL